MTLRQEIYTYIDNIPESKLVALKPLLFALADDSIVVEYDLTDDELELVKQGMVEYEDNPNSFVPLELMN